MNITTDVKNVLLQRRELTLTHPSASNPGYDTVLKVLAEKMGSTDDVVVIKRLTNAYGSSDFLIEAFVYDSAEARQKFEPKPKATKGGAS